MLWTRTELQEWTSVRSLARISEPDVLKLCFKEDFTKVGHQRPARAWEREIEQWFSMPDTRVWSSTQKKDSPRDIGELPESCPIKKLIRFIFLITKKVRLHHIHHQSTQIFTINKQLYSLSQTDFFIICVGSKPTNETDIPIPLGFGTAQLACHSRRVSFDCARLQSRVLLQQERRLEKEYSKSPSQEA